MAARGSAAAQQPNPHQEQAAAMPLTPAWKPGPDLHLCACAAPGGFGAGELPATPPCTSVLQKCWYRGLTFINSREEEIMLAKYCQILQIND